MDLTREQKLELYRFMRLNRVVEERLVNLYRQGKVVGGLYRSLGQEATSVGTAYALNQGDIVGPLIRNLGVVLVMGYSPRDVMTQYMARATSPSGGKDCNLHFGRPDRGVISPISMLGALVPVMAGIALAGPHAEEGHRHDDLDRRRRHLDRRLPRGHQLRRGAEAAARRHRREQRLGVLDAVPQADRGTLPRRQGRRRTGSPGEQVDGNDVLAVHDAARRAVDRARSGGGPTLVEAVTYRMKGHAEHDAQAYVPKEELEEWKQKDPIARYARRPRRIGRGLGATSSPAIDQAIAEEVDREVERAEKSPLPAPEFALEGVYARRADPAAPTPSPSIVRRRP